MPPVVRIQSSIPSVLWFCSLPPLFTPKGRIGEGKQGMEESGVGGTRVVLAC